MSGNWGVGNPSGCVVDTGQLSMLVERQARDARRMRDVEKAFDQADATWGFLHVRRVGASVRQGELVAGNGMMVWVIAGNTHCIVRAGSTVEPDKYTFNAVCEPEELMEVLTNALIQNSGNQEV